MAMEPAVTSDPIRHVVLLILENHSFDQMLGCLKGIYPSMEGVAPAEPRENQDDAGIFYRQSPTTERQMFVDPHHELEHVAVQLENQNDGFVRDFVRAYPDSTSLARNFIMGYYPLDFLPALHALARHFTICDHWFSSLPGPTWPNRFFALTGTSHGRVNMPQDGQHLVDVKGWFEQDQDTIFDRLSEKAIDWKVYFQGIPQTVALCHQRRALNAARYFYMGQFYDDARGAEEDFPQFCLIEPDFVGSGENDDHPPHDIMKAQKLMADVYNALRSNAALWESTLLVIIYDEHGGFYDHVVPPPAVPPDDHQQEYTFDQYGLRVPAILVSPWVKREVNATLFDHTSVLKYLIDKWHLGPLGRRAAMANSIGIALQTGMSLRDDTPVRINLTTQQLVPPDARAEDKAESTRSAHHIALGFLTHYLKVVVVENLPLFYTACARLLEGTKGLIQRWLSWFYKESPAIVVAVQPDKLARDKQPLREQFAKFLGHQKPRALPALARILRDPKVSNDQRHHALRTLAVITGRKFHREQNGLVNADQWLKKYGY